MKPITKLTLIAILALSCQLLAISLYAEIPRLINYQGKLTDAAGAPITGTRNVTFRIYELESGGSPIWTETQSITLTKGIFSVLLGGVTALNVSFDKPYWLGIQVEGDPEMSPRLRFATSSYAFRAENANNAAQAQNANTSQQTIAVEARTSDPASPTTGQIWLRTDL